MAAFEIPVVFVDRNGATTSDRVMGAPCIRVGFYVTPASTKKDKAVEAVWALLDTSADFGYIDVNLAAKHQAPRAGSDDVTRLAKGAEVYRAWMYLLEPNIHLPGFYIGRDLAARGFPYQLILGRVFFTAARLDFDSSDGPCRLMFETLKAGIQSSIVPGTSNTD